ncbi:hypothetical protein DSL92_01960 [Billgrantia gudaonensis]|uniref:histidine kinase n=1 Tax=Billgrantia gudaonensis TaxID=376427 RepID=A0A3S0NEH8_9GAMM|nr:hypothetical protein DSL92_01960 [Halomonas gudaonensis]
MLSKRPGDRSTGLMPCCWLILASEPGWPAGRGFPDPCEARDNATARHSGVASRELQATARSAEMASRAKSEFPRSATIRTPLNGVIGMSELLLEQPLSERANEYAQISWCASGQRPLEMINAISTLRAGSSRDGWS